MRKTEASVDDDFVSRWSPRAFDPDPIDADDLKTVFEAARWAPSCFNEQPWLFVYATSAADRERVTSVLASGNQTWASRAPVLGVVFARRRFDRNGKPNRWAAFDSGAAAFSLALQAHRRGLATHFMGGFDQDAAYAALEVPSDDFEAIAAFALGRPGDPASLPDELRERERPSDRRSLAQIAHEGRFRGGSS